MYNAFKYVLLNSLAAENQSIFCIVNQTVTKKLSLCTQSMRSGQNSLLHLHPKSLTPDPDPPLDSTFFRPLS